MRETTLKIDVKEQSCFGLPLADLFEDPSSKLKVKIRLVKFKVVIDLRGNVLGQLFL